MKIRPIYRRYKHIFIIAILFWFLFIAGCAGGGTEVGNPASPDAAGGPAPSISNLDYNVETGEEEITLTGSVDFTDDDGNISHLIIDIIDSDNKQVKQVTEPIEGFSGQTSGKVEFNIHIDAEPGNYDFEIYIMDETANESNVLPGTFSVTA